MASITSDKLPSVTDSNKSKSGTLGDFRSIWREFLIRAFDPYRPELHYMRGPGPACRAKQLQSSRRETS